MITCRGVALLLFCGMMVACQSRGTLPYDPEVSMVDEAPNSDVRAIVKEKCSACLGSGVDVYSQPCYRCLGKGYIEARAGAN